MSAPCRSISDSPRTIHSAIDLPTPGPSLIHTAAADHSPFTSGVSPRIGAPSGVRDSKPLQAYFSPIVSSPTMSGMSSIACSSCRSKSSCVKGISVGDKAACSLEGISPASYKIARCAYEPISKPVPCCRSYMKVSMSRMIGHSISPLASAKNGTGPMSFIWCTAGVNGIAAPAISAIRGLQQPHAITTYSVLMVPRSVTTADTRPSVTSMSMTSVLGKLVRAFISCAFSRMMVPALSESTTPTDGVQKPPRITSSSM